LEQLRIASKLSSLPDEPDGLVQIVQQIKISGREFLIGRGDRIIPTFCVSQLAQTANDCSILAGHAAKLLFPLH
jgi:hypothetical protein